MKLLRKLLFAALLFVPFAVMSEPVVDINTADSEMLVDSLVGVGPQKAMAIIRYRQQNGPFQRVEDLSLVSGIGEKTVERNRERITLTYPESP